MRFFLPNPAFDPLLPEDEEENPMWVWHEPADGELPFDPLIADKILADVVYHRANDEEESIGMYLWEETAAGSRLFRTLARLGPGTTNVTWSTSLGTGEASGPGSYTPVTYRIRGIDDANDLRLKAGNDNLEFERYPGDSEWWYVKGGSVNIILYCQTPNGKRQYYINENGTLAAIVTTDKVTKEVTFQQNGPLVIYRGHFRVVKTWAGKVEFGGISYNRINLDNGNLVEIHQWLDEDGNYEYDRPKADRTIGYPICYTRGSELSIVNLTIKGNSSLPFLSNLWRKGKFQVKWTPRRYFGSGYPMSFLSNVEEAHPYFIIDAGTTEASISGLKITMPDMVYYEPGAVFDYIFVHKGASLNVGYSIHPLYITWDRPNRSRMDGKLYETPLQIGCRNASGLGTGSSNDNVVAAIWSEFESNVSIGIKRVDGKILKYWHKWEDYQGTPSTDPRRPKQDIATALLPSSIYPTDSEVVNAACGVFADLFNYALYSQGITTGVGFYDVRSTYGGRMLIKNWEFARVGAGTYPYKGIEKDRVLAQGNDKSPPHFVNHFVSMYDGKIYDPSYATGPFIGKLDWQDASIDGFEEPGGVFTRKLNEPPIIPREAEVIFTIFSGR